MFWKRNKKYLLDSKIIKKSNVPILNQDQAWRDIILSQNNRLIHSLSSQLEALLQQEALLKNDIQVKKKIKEESMQQILQLSDLINTKGQESSLTEMELAKENFSAASEALEQLYLEQEEYPGKIQGINHQLLEETVKIAYGDLVKGLTDLNKTNEQIVVHRDKLNQLRTHKEELEVKMDYLYSFMHTIIGPQEMQKLDIHYLKKTEE